MNKPVKERYFIDGKYINKCMEEFREKRKDIEWVKKMQENKASVWAIHRKWLKLNGIYYHKKTGRWYCKNENDHLMCVLKYE